MLPLELQILILEATFELLTPPLADTVSPNGVLVGKALRQFLSRKISCCRNLTRLVLTRNLVNAMQAIYA